MARKGKGDEGSTDRHHTQLRHADLSWRLYMIVEKGYKRLLPVPLSRAFCRIDDEYPPSLDGIPMSSEETIERECVVSVCVRVCVCCFFINRFHFSAALFSLPPLRSFLPLSHNNRLFFHLPSSSSSSSSSLPCPLRLFTTARNHGHLVRSSTPARALSRPL